MSAKTSTNTIILSRENALWLAELGLSSASTDWVTPLLCGAHVEVEGETARVSCTDRYRATTGVVELTGEPKPRRRTEPHSFVMPLPALQWLKKNIAFHGRLLVDLQRVVITTTPSGDPDVAGRITISIQASGLPDAAATAWTGDLGKGTFPPIHRLFETARAAEPAIGNARVRLDFFGKARGLGHRGEAPLIKFTATDTPHKPGPIYIEFRRHGSPSEPIIAEVVIQPNLMLR